MTGRRYTEQEKAKVRAMMQYGLSKNKAAQILHIAPSTIWRWSIPATFKNKVYPPETRQLAEKLHKSGLSRLRISIKLGVGLHTINRWLGKGRDGRKFKMYPIELRQRARLLARSGVLKTEIPNILKVSYPAVVRWTSDIKQDKSRVSGRYFRLFSGLINNGFVMLNRKELRLYRILKRYAKIKAVAFGKKLIVMVPGKEKAALKAFLGSSESGGMTKRKIGGATRAFLGSANHGI